MTIRHGGSDNRCSRASMTPGSGFVSMASCLSQERPRDSVRSSTVLAPKSRTAHSQVKPWWGSATTCKPFQQALRASNHVIRRGASVVHGRKANCPRGREASEAVRTPTRGDGMYLPSKRSFVAQQMYLPTVGRTEKGRFSLRASRSISDLRFAAFPLREGQTNEMHTEAQRGRFLPRSSLIS